MQDRLFELALEVLRVTEEKIDVIDAVMRRTGVLALNARLEAARAGASGQAFAVVAQEMGTVAQSIREVSAELRGAIAGNVALLRTEGERMQTELRGARLADLARNAVEIMDRNLYERSCDVRWWATDSAFVDLLDGEGGAGAARHAGARLATILRSYTVYLDLWVADAAGRVVATGRPERYPHALGSDVALQPWFARAIATPDGDSFAICDVAANPMLHGAAAATYSTAIRRGGASDGAVIGALGIFFDWAPQAAAILAGVRDTVDAPGDTCVMLLDHAFRILATSDGADRLGEPFPLHLADPQRGHAPAGDRLVAYALTPGYETYRGLGWYGCIDAPLAPRG